MTEPTTQQIYEAISTHTVETMHQYVQYILITNVIDLCSVLIFIALTIALCLNVKNTYQRIKEKDKYITSVLDVDDDWFIIKGTIALVSAPFATLVAFIVVPAKIKFIFLCYTAPTVALLEHVINRH